MKWDRWCSSVWRFNVEIPKKRLIVWKTPTVGLRGSCWSSLVEEQETKREHLILQAADRQSRRSPGSSPMHAALH